MPRYFLSIVVFLALFATPASAADNSAGDSGMLCRRSAGRHLEGSPVTCRDDATKQTANFPLTTTARTAPDNDGFSRLTCAVMVTKTAASSAMPACDYSFTDEGGTVRS